MLFCQPKQQPLDPKLKFDVGEPDVEELEEARAPPPPAQSDAAPARGGSAARPRLSNVVVGGSFDRLHPGHSVLLSTAAALTSSRLIVGVADGPLLAHKLLGELIEPLEERSAAVMRLLNTVRPDVESSVLPITTKDVRTVNPVLWCGLPVRDLDAVAAQGGSAQDAKYDGIVVSEESLKGALRVNQQRAAKNFPPMHIETIRLLPSSVSARPSCRGSSAQVNDSLCANLHRVLLQAPPLWPPTSSVRASCARRSLASTSADRARSPGPRSRRRTGRTSWVSPEALPVVRMFVLCSAT